MAGSGSPIVIVPYDGRWPARFERERLGLGRVFDGVDATIEHVGSTAVPGLGGKPILDIMIGVRSLEDIESRIDDLEALGYEYVREYESQLPERRYFRKSGTQHVHCVQLGGPFWASHLRFRDHLRAHPEIAEAYYQLKRELAERYRDDRVAYLEGKSSFIESVLE